ncbi:hypothetical protein BYT27DRAFT_7218505 [Phlegmacium glaucopus]|nr:hypothetical protein BYT27DRAFT_7218505 [Phlegmacium glaucopus]
MTAVQYAAFIQFQKDQKKTSTTQQHGAQKETKAQQDLAIQECNRLLQEEEESDELDGETPAPKRPKTNHITLSDEAAMAAQLGDDGIITLSEEEGSENGEQQVMITLETSEDVKPDVKALLKCNRLGGSSKVVQGNFSDNVTVLADAAKTLICTKVAFGDWVLDSNPEKMTWIWSIINEVPGMIGISLRGAAQEGIKEASRDVALRNKLVTYVSYGKGALLNTIIVKARQRVFGHYGLNGTTDQIKTKVNWLLEKSHFLYGDLGGLYSPPHFPGGLWADCHQKISGKHQIFTGENRCFFPETVQWQFHCLSGRIISPPDSTNGHSGGQSPELGQ